MHQLGADTGDDSAIVNHQKCVLVSLKHVLEACCCVLWKPDHRTVVG